MTTPAPALPDDPGLLKAMLLEERAESERLRLIIKALQRHRFGRRAESLPEDQLLLALEEAEQAEAAGHAKAEETGPAEKTARVAKRRANRGALPAHLPRIETVMDVDKHDCPCCSGPLHRIGEDVSERLDVVPAQFRVVVVRRPKYACRSCEEVVVQAPAPARLIEGGLPTDADRRARARLEVRRPSAAVSAGSDLRPPGSRRSIARPWPTGSGAPPSCSGPCTSGCSTGSSSRISCSPMRPPRRCSILDGAAPRPASSGRMPAMTGHGVGPTRPAWPMSTPRTARRSGPITHLAGFRGVLQVDGYEAYKVLAKRGEVQLAFCWSHVRRPFYELAQSGSAPIATEALARIAALYKIESEIRGRSAEERRAVRQDRSRPLVEAFEPWLREKLALISQKSKLAEAIRYALTRWPGLTLFLDDGRIEIDTNVVERASARWP